MRLYESRLQKVVDFEPVREYATAEASRPPPVVRMYTCGITPYDATHVGHAATFLTYDVLQRRLRDMGLETRCVRNVTDVDDSLLARARSLGVHYLDLAATALATFEFDMQALGLLAPYSEPRATSAISDVRQLIGRVLQSGHAYQSGGAVYFDVSASPSFGSLSHLDRDTMLGLAAEHGGRLDDPSKRDPLDFVLWQPSEPGEPQWSSLWGPGRPGWHVECSALALRELGSRIDLHGGGRDLIFPHHECEVIQAEAATGEPFVRHWMHSGIVRFDGRKMAKSHRNLAFVSELRRTWDPMAIRLAILGARYRSTWDWSPELVEVAARRLARWRSVGEGEAGLEEVRVALDDDLDTPRAIAIIDAACALGGVSDAAELLGVVW
jgi:L-cysteine:1D-myo-inositol 2-amino-2-deoxy-alpha-D-glucopyranoside ligase